MNKALLTRIWQECLIKLQNTLGQTIVQTWILPLVLQEEESQRSKTLLLEAPNAFFKDWVSRNYLSVIHNALKECLMNEGFSLQVKIIAKDKAGSQDIRINEYQGDRLQKKKDSFILNPRFTFDNFVVGPCNRFAYAASMAIAESPARAYNPLFIYGGVGLGKTHLMQAICHYIQNQDKAINICYMPSERFTNELIDAIQHRSTSMFRQRYRNMDILVIDDIHFIAGKESTQEEFFNTFNALYDAHKQIIISSDRSPRDIQKLEERLISRFSWGLITDIQPPDFETRVAILKKKIEREPVNLSDEVVFFIAQVIKTNIRELEGALIRVVARSVLEEKPITMELTKQVLKDCIQETKRPVHFQRIQECVASEFGISLQELRAKQRSKNIVLPRQVAMYLSRQLTEASLPEIARFFGGRDHTTILHAWKKINTDLKTNQGLKQKIDNIIKYLQQ